MRLQRHGYAGIGVLVLGLVVALSSGAGPAWALTPEGCLVAKAKAWNKLRGCQRGQAMKAIVGKPVDPSRCQSRFDASFTKIQAKADGLGLAEACRFVDNGDGTVTDFDTGLMWARLLALDGVPNSANVLDADNAYDWDGAAGAAAVLSGVSAGAAPPVSASGFPRYDDWRLPTITELVSIVDCSFGGPCFRPELGPSRLGTHYWSSSTDAQNASVAWRVYSTGGVLGTTGKNGTEAVRPVRTAW